ncbi:hypothetical protein ACIP93_18245 [Streptomyces sp. NPDC088745]|uniref:hypothetical protein n=1 Tax=Streptomyces sp. NPDC088745 TaxID=3365884 RepID=UPI0038089C92
MNASSPQRAGSSLSTAETAARCFEGVPVGARPRRGRVPGRQGVRFFAYGTVVYDVEALEVLPEGVRTEDARGEEHAAALITSCGRRTSGC